MSDPAVSIAIRAYRRETVGDAIASVLAQTWRDLELVVYDDAGDLEDLVRSFGDPRVRYFRPRERLSASERFHAAVELCRGEYVGLLDDDDVHEPEFVTRLVGALAADPEAGLAFCQNTWVTPDGSVVPASFGLAEGRVSSAASLFVTRGLLVQPSLALMRRAAYNAAMDGHAMPAGVAPDVYVCVRIAAAGWGAVLVDEPLARRAWRPTDPDPSIEIETFSAMEVDDPALEALRLEQVARAHLRMAVSRVRSGDTSGARADLRSAAVADARAWAWPRRALGAVARTGPLARLFARAWLSLPPVRARTEQPPTGPLATARPQERDGVGRDALTFASGTVFAQVLLVAIAPILTRLYSPAELGAGAVLAGLFGTATIACLQLDWAIPLARSRAETAAVCAASLLTALVLAVATAGLVAVAGGAFVDAANVPELRDWLWLFPLHVAIVGVALTAAGILVRQRRFGRLASTRAAQAVGQAGVSVGGGVAGAGGGALGAAVTGGWAAYGAVAVAGAVKGARPGLRAVGREGLRGARAAAREWRGFRAWGTVGTVASNFREAAVPALVAALYGPAAAGVLFVAQRVLQAPMALAAEAVSRAWFGTAAEIVRTGAPGMQAAFVRVTRGLVLVGGPIIAVAAIAGPFLFAPVFGSDLDDGGELLVVLAPLYLAMLVAVPSGQALIALGRTQLTAAVLISRLVVAAIAIVVADGLGLGLTWAVGLYAAGMVAISLALGVVAWRLTGSADAVRAG